MEAVVLGTLLAFHKNITQRDRSIANLIINQRILIDHIDIKLILTRLDIKAESLVEDGVETLGLLGSLFVGLLRARVR